MWRTLSYQSEIDKSMRYTSVTSLHRQILRSYANMKTDVQKVECQSKDEDRDTFPDFHDFELFKTCLLEDSIPEKNERIFQSSLWSNAEISASF